MPFYDLSKPQREALVAQMHTRMLHDVSSGIHTHITNYFADEDTYIRKSAYIAIGRIYFAEKFLRKKIIALLDELLKSEDFKTRQTAINAAGEIGKKDFEIVQHFFDIGLFDAHHSPRNAVIGSIKKMGEVNPTPVLEWAKKYLHHPDKEIRREICHGIELRGRKYPQDILPLLQELEFDQTARVRSTLIHVLGQIAYKKDCLQTVIAHLKNWKNKPLITAALEEIIDVHHRYRNFSTLTQQQAKDYIAQEWDN
jgi:hypothetical protein